MAENAHNIAADTDRDRVLQAALELVPYDGWTEKTLAESVKSAGVAPVQLAILFPRGIADLLRYWDGALNMAIAERAASDDFAALKVREKVARLVEARLAALEDHREAARRAAATLALPHYAPLGAQLAWGVSDAIWRALGDGSTDFNFYSKRAVLTAVWTSTFARWLSDDSDDRAATREFLADRIENVMQFEKLKARLRDVKPDTEKFIGALAKARFR